ncbi:MAG: hypothetical protein JO130_06520, partial [Solirubrobacterales bacterium]|nr:hypothetical protein [Solirubrobacterales bacterium]
MTDRQRNGFILLLVLGLVLGSLVVIVGIPGAVKSKKTVLGLDLKGGVQLVYQGEPSPQTPKVTPDALQRAVDIMRSRVDQLGVSEPEISTYGGNQISVGLPDVSDTARAEREVGTTAQLAFYDWEANALTPSGKIVANQLQSQDSTAIAISQGATNLSPGDPGAGSMGLYQAVQLASKQTPWSSKSNLRYGPQYWLFGAPGSAACATAARDAGTVPVTGEHCLLAGQEQSVDSLKSDLPNGVSFSEGQLLTVPQGWIVLQAIPANFSKPPAISDPSSQFYVLKDNVALRGSEISNPQESSDPNTSEPDVTFGFTSKGKNAFQNVTAAIARRGSLVSGLGQSLNQHFAVALDNQLITVPYIDYKQY